MKKKKKHTIYFGKFEKELLKLVKNAERKKFVPHIHINVDGNCLEVILEDVSYYHEWIRGEGADIGIWRANDDERVVGVTLPLRKWNKKDKIRVY